jgi:hypothetical protein
MRKPWSHVRSLLLGFIGALLILAVPAAAGPRTTTATATSQPRCKPGAVLAYALIDPAHTSQTAFSVAGTAPRFNCADPKNRVLVKEFLVDTFYYFDVFFPGISKASNDAGDLVATVTQIGSNTGLGYLQCCSSRPKWGHGIQVVESAPGQFTVALLGYRRG